MATNTTNYNLIKPDATDFYDINVQNQNMDVIDETLSKKFDKSGGHISGNLAILHSGEPTLETVGLYISANPSINGQSQHRASIALVNEGLAGGVVWIDTDGTLKFDDGTIYTSENKPSLSELGAAPSGFGLGSLCKNIDNQDIVAIARSGQSGFYAGVNVTNAPDTAYHMYLVICFSNQVSKVLCFDFYNLFIKMAAISFNTWTGWKSVVETTVIPASVE